MRGPVVGAGVGLELDDPSDAPTRGVITDEVRAEERPRRLERADREETPIERA